MRKETEKGEKQKNPEGKILSQASACSKNHYQIYLMTNLNTACRQQIRQWDHVEGAQDGTTDAKLPSYDGYSQFKVNLQPCKCRRRREWPKMTLKGGESRRNVCENESDETAHPRIK